jgi:hypothetical protein
MAVSIAQELVAPSTQDERTSAVETVRREESTFSGLLSPGEKERSIEMLGVALDWNGLSAVLHREVDFVPQR